MEEKKKTSWDYQKVKNYKQVKITFNLDDPVDGLIYRYLCIHTPNRTSLIKRLLYEEMVRWSEYE